MLKFISAPLPSILIFPFSVCYYYCCWCYWFCYCWLAFMSRFLCNACWINLSLICLSSLCCCLRITLYFKNSSYSSSIVMSKMLKRQLWMLTCGFELWQCYYTHDKKLVWLSWDKKFCQVNSHLRGTYIRMAAWSLGGVPPWEPSKQIRHRIMGIVVLCLTLLILVRVDWVLVRMTWGLLAVIVVW